MFGLSYLRLGIYAAAALAFVALFGWGKWQQHKATSAIAERDALQGQLHTAVDANASLVTTVDVQKRALAEWAALGVSQEEIAGWRDQIGRHKDRADKLHAENQMLRSKDRALPECVALLRISLESRCPSVAAGLRQLANGGQNNSH